MKVYKILLAVLAAGVLFSCDNQDVSFPDFDYTTVYFANQYPLRTLELGNDPQVDNSLDNEHKVKITATIGGVYANNEDRIIDISVDESLCDGVSFVDGPELLPMPASYYSLETNQIVIKAGDILGGVVVQLTDAFFNDPLSISNKYAIPLVMTGVTNADSILSGKAIVANPNRMVGANWQITPKDYVLYAVKYVNPWDANYLRRGVDVITNGSNSSTVVRHKEYVEKDELVELTTVSLSEVKFMPDGYTSHYGIHLPLSVKFAFNENQECSITSENQSIQVNDSVRVYNIVAQGNGEFVPDGEENSIGGFDRDAIYLDYEVAFEVETTFPKSGDAPVYEVQHYVTKDTLVCRDRGIVPEYYGITVE